MPRQSSGPLASQISPVSAIYITDIFNALIGIHEYLYWHTSKLSLMSWHGSLVGLWYVTVSFYLLFSKLTIMDLGGRDM